MAPGLAIPGRPARAAMRVPRFSEWVGRTARLRGDNGEARLFLERAGTGLIAIRLFFLCRPLPVLDWRIADDGLTLTYRRQSALRPARVIEGSARIAPDAGHLRWIEAADHLAEFEGFEAPEAVNACG